jgi:biopolymer transport protein ExbB
MKKYGIGALLLMPLKGFSAEIESTFDIVKVFQSCPIIYSLLLLMSVAALSIWLYSLLTLRLNDMMPEEFMASIRELFTSRRYEEAQHVCQQDPSYSASIISVGLMSRKFGPQMMVEAMQAEGRRFGNRLWQRVALLNEIAVVAPMLGLLGTVLGLFLAFYDSNHTVDNIVSIFDGFGVAVGTTVVGLVVSILAMILYTTLKFRVVNLLNTIENESLALVTLVDRE